jgi:2-polyprenyl-3-methyl-5-hydroxy-6-metoxy-1,4-benzoquinol methylase
LEDLRINKYLKSFAKYGVTPKALRWHSQKSAEQRYQQIISEISFNGKSILDVGCGFGDLIPWLAKSGKVTYTGIDLMPEFIKVARGRYPEGRFVVGDYFQKPLKEKFDIIIACGCLNSNVEDNLNWRKKAIKAMFDHAKEGVIFNMAGRHPQPDTAKRNNVWYADSLDILKYCLTLTHKIIFRSHYAKREFTIFCFK